MQKERFEYKQGIIGCEWAIIAPIVVSLLFSLIGVLYCNSSGQTAESLNDNAVFKTIVTISTELSFLVTALIIALKGRTNFVTGLGLKTRTPFWVYLGAVAVSVAVLLLLNPIINCWQYMLENANYTVGKLPFEADSAGLLILSLFLFALLPALCEEALFRGVILNSLRKYGLVVSVGMSALFFSLMHMNLLQLPYTFLLGVVLGLVVYFTRNLWLSILMHFVNNSTVLIINYVNDEAYGFVWYDILWGIGGLILFVGLLFLIYKLLKATVWNKICAEEQAQCDLEPAISQRERRVMWVAPILIGVACLVISILGGFKII